MADSCECDDCSRKSTMLKGLELTAALLPAPDAAMAQTMEELRAAVVQHAARARAGRGRGGEEAARSFLQSSAQRPWLSYDPDAFLPLPFDTFLLSGVCPAPHWERPVGGSLPEPSGEAGANANVDADADVAAVAVAATGAAAEAGSLGVGASPSLDDVDLSICFIVGCGRSGTTVLADILSHHCDVLLLNEPRQLWIPHLPSMDVWSVDSKLRAGRLAFEPEDVTPSLVEAMRQEYRGVVEAFLARQVQETAAKAKGRARAKTKEGVSRRRIVLLEKLPEHCFRMRFLSELCSRTKLFQSWKFVHIVRGGVAVARSIAAFENPAAWYGAKADSKWKALKDLKLNHRRGGAAFCEALSKAAAKSLRGRFGRGLLEWALSEVFAREARSARRSALNATGLGEEEDDQEEAITFLEVQYESLATDPAVVARQVLAFCGLSSTAAAGGPQGRGREGLEAEAEAEADEHRENLEDGEALEVVEQAAKKVMRPLTQQAVLTAQEESAVVALKTLLEEASSREAEFNPELGRIGSDPGSCGDGNLEFHQWAKEHIVAIVQLLSLTQ